MYSLDIFKENKIDYTWDTVFVGRKLGLLKPAEVTRHAVEYLLENPECNDPYIAELASGVSDNEVDELLEKALESIGHQNIKKMGPFGT